MVRAEISETGVVRVIRRYWARAEMLIPAIAVLQLMAVTALVALLHFHGSPPALPGSPAIAATVSAMVARMQPHHECAPGATMLALGWLEAQAHAQAPWGFPFSVAPPDEAATSTSGATVSELPEHAYGASQDSGLKQLAQAQPSFHDAKLPSIDVDPALRDTITTPGGPQGTLSQVPTAVPAPSHDPGEGESQQAEAEAAQATANAKSHNTFAQDDTWLRAQNPRHLTLQLLSARQPQTLEKLVAKHRLPGAVLFVRSVYRGLPLYSLVYGVYSSSAEAVKAARALQAELQVQPWVRTVASVQAQVQAAGAGVAHRTPESPER